MFQCMHCHRRCRWQDWHVLGWVRIPGILDPENGVKYICPVCWGMPIRLPKKVHKSRLGADKALLSVSKKSNNDTNT